MEDIRGVSEGGLTAQSSDRILINLFVRGKVALSKVLGGVVAGSGGASEGGAGGGGGVAASGGSRIRTKSE